ncbi:MAG: nucleotide sugar dehydrogenase [Candidatus Levyibacteriota bacterium]
MIKQKNTIAIIGIGRVGLPFALVLADSGYIVYGIGRDKAKIDTLLQGIMPFKEEGIESLKKHIGKEFIPTTSYEPISEANIIILTLGTPIDENMNPVLDQINITMEKLTKYLKKGQLIILRSTLSPNTTRYVKEALELQTKFKVGRDIYLAYCPERIAEGKAIDEIRELPQIVGGIDPISSRRAANFFSSFQVKCHITDAKSAELAKLFSNMYRYISFAIANEFMVLAESYNRNIHEIVDLVNTGYKRGGLALPGLTAGPCLFKDGFFLINENPFSDLISMSWKINETIPLFLVKKLRERINVKGKKVVILGLAFKPEIDDIRESLSFKIRKALLREHAKVVLHDPYVKNYQGQPVLKDLPEAIEKADAIIIATRHNMYIKNKSKILKAISKDTYICDIWNVFGINKLVFTANQVKK